jgi:hypothetical protein
MRWALHRGRWGDLRSRIISAQSWSDGVFSPARILCSTGCGVPFPSACSASSPQRQPSRLYGDSLSDMIAPSTNGTLATVEGIEKLAVSESF